MSHLRASGDALGQHPEFEVLTHSQQQACPWGGSWLAFEDFWWTTSTFVFLEENNTVETYGKFCTRKASENRCVIFYHSSDTE